ncbi:MAG: LicD family protein [Prevotella sp.]|nr:LicD family protein [Prevotella sp.]
MKEEFVVSAKRRKLWNIEKEMLRRVLDICQRHNLKIWMDGGSLLGVVRHKGFIPWDDDIDLAMMREDYDKFINLPQEEFAPYFLQTAYTDKDYAHGHAQVRERNTAAISPVEWTKDFCQGIFIDIFPLDAVPDSEEEFKELGRRSMEMKRLMEAKGRFYLFKQHDVLENLRTWLKARWLFRQVDFRDYYREFEDLFRHYRREDNAKVGTISFIPSMAKDKHIYDETLWLPFEDMTVPAPAGYDLLLRTIYGDDYMTPRRAPAFHGGMIFDTERSYKEVLKEIRSEHTFCKDVVRRLRKFLGMKNPKLTEEKLMEL